MAKNKYLHNPSEIVIEYLIMSPDIEFCNSNEAFKQLLSVDSRITIIDEYKLSMKVNSTGILTVSYEVDTDIVPNKKERYFKFKIKSKEVERINDLTQLTALLESSFARIDNEVSVHMLWNDISRIYAVEGYALINEVENLLRRLITSFLLTRVGFDFPKHHIPSGVKNRADHLKVSDANYLHQTFFDDLKTILFEGQRAGNFENIGEIERLVQKLISEGRTEISIDELKGVIATSLWDKYFAAGTSYDKSKLQTDLDLLNGLRNEIAHNRHVNRQTLGKIQNLSEKIIKTLKLAIEDLPEKNLTVEEQEFQIDAENNRLTKARGGGFSETVESVLDYYRNRYGASYVDEVDTLKRLFGVEFIVNQRDQKPIAVEILKVNSNVWAIDRLNLSIEYQLKDDSYGEFHLVYVFVDSDPIVQKEKLSRALVQLKSIKVPLRILQGVVDLFGKFELLSESIKYPDQDIQ